MRRRAVHESVEIPLAFGDILCLSVPGNRSSRRTNDRTGRRQEKKRPIVDEDFSFFFSSSNSRAALLSCNAIARERDTEERSVISFSRIDTRAFKFAVKTSRRRAIQAHLCHRRSHQRDQSVGRMSAFIRRRVEEAPPRALSVSWTRGNLLNRDVFGTNVSDFTYSCVTIVRVSKQRQPSSRSATGYTVEERPADRSVTPAAFSVTSSSPQQPKKLALSRVIRSFPTRSLRDAENERRKSRRLFIATH